MEKSDNNNAYKSLFAISRHNRGSIREKLSWNQHALTDNLFETAAEELYAWGEKPDSTDIYEFYDYLWVPRTTFIGWMERSPLLKQAFEDVKIKIGVRCRKLAMFKSNECNEKTIHRTLHLYHPDWKQAAQEETDLRVKLNESESKEPIVVTLKRD